MLSIGGGREGLGFKQSESMLPESVENTAREFPSLLCAFEFVVIEAEDLECLVAIGELAAFADGRACGRPVSIDADERRGIDLYEVSHLGDEARHGVAYHGVIPTDKLECWDFPSRIGREG